MSQQSCSSCSKQDSNTSSINPAKNWCFTYNHHTLEIICSICSICSIYCDKYVFQEEKGESGTPHLQGFLRFKRKRRPFSVFKDRGFHWEITRNVTASIRYCSASSKRSGRIWTSGIRELQLETVRVLDESLFYDWQRTALTFLDDESDRTIYWIYEGSGNTGKSSFVKYLAVKRGAFMVSGKAADSKYGIVKFYEQFGKYPSLITVDIPRCMSDYVSYQALESIKNGHFFSGKYESGMCVFNSPVIICFANTMPEIDKMSLDRWQVYEIVNRKLLKINIVNCVSS